jgi:hypothetical protein
LQARQSPGTTSRAKQALGAKPELRIKKVHMKRIYFIWS